MKKIDAIQAVFLCNGRMPSTPFCDWSHYEKKFWTEAAKRINNHFLGDSSFDEQSNECPIPNLQEGP